MNLLVKSFFCLLGVICSAFPYAFAADKNELDVLRQAKVFTAAGRYKDAVELLKKFVPEERSEELVINLIAGDIYLNLDRPASALEYYEKAYDQDLENFEAAIGLATSYMKLGNFKKARQYISIASEIAKSSPAPALISSLISLRTGNIKEANSLMQTLMRERPDSSEVAISYAKYLSLSGDNLGALRELQLFVVRYPQIADAKDYLGEMEFLFGNKTNAIKQKRAALDLYDLQGNTFQKDVVTAWLEVNSPPQQVQKPIPQAPKELPPKKESIPVQEIEKAPPRPSDKQAKRVNLNPLPKPTDKEFATPLQRFPFPDGSAISGGSGFIVDGGKKVVTNRHVIDGGKEFAIRTGLGEVIKARVIYISQTDDIAVLELDKALPADRSIPNNAYSKPRVGRNVVVMGYPLWYILGQGSPSLTNGIVSKRTGMRDDLGTFQLTAKVNKGNSGGPVFDMSGNVVGITVGKLDSKRIQDEEGFVPEDVNFAIHVDRLPKIINSSPDSKNTEASEMTTEELYQVMLGKVVMVATYK